MKCKSVVTVAVFCVATCAAWNVQAQTLGQVGQSVSVEGRGVAGDQSSGVGNVTTAISSSYSDSNFSATYDIKARASAGEVGVYNQFIYNTTGEWVGSQSYATSTDILDVFDAANANRQIGITFSTYIHGALSSTKPDIYAGHLTGYVTSSLIFGTYDSGTSSWQSGGGGGVLFEDRTEPTSTRYGAQTPSFTYYLMLDSTGHGQLATALTLESSNFEEGGTTSGSMTANYYNTVGITVGAQSASTTITSQGGWNVGSVSAVPEPETYAMLLVGLGLVSVAARRRQRQTV